MWPTLKEWVVLLPFLEGGAVYEIIWNSSAQELSLLPHGSLQLLICIDVDSWIFIVYLGYSPVLLFCCSDESSSGHWELLELASGYSGTSVLRIFLSTFSPPRCSSSFCHFLVPGLESAISLRSLVCTTCYLTGNFILDCSSGP